MKGIFHLTASFDTVGAIGKTALDVALACDALLPTKEGVALGSIAASAELGDICVGFLDIEKWRLPAHTQADDPRYFEQTVRLRHLKEGKY